MKPDDASSGGRHRGREVALQVLYAVDLYETGQRDARAARAEGGFDPAQSAARRSGVAGALSIPADSLLDEGAVASEDGPFDPVAAAALAFDRVQEHFVVPRSAIGFARELVTAVTARAEALDEMIAAHARNWRVSRMAAVDRNVLRLAVYELRDTDTPVAVVIDEAVDLAHRFGSDSSPGFVNGILDAIAREVRAA